MTSATNRRITPMYPVKFAGFLDAVNRVGGLGERSAKHLDTAAVRLGRLQRLYEHIAYDYCHFAPLLGVSVIDCITSFYLQAKSNGLFCKH
jgi:hypothetical protein